MCNDGYISNGVNGGKIIKEQEECINSLHSKGVKVTSNQVIFQIKKSTAEAYKGTIVMKHYTPNNIKIILNNNNFNTTENDKIKTYKFSNLEPGT